MILKHPFIKIIGGEKVFLYRNYDRYTKRLRPVSMGNDGVWIKAETLREAEQKFFEFCDDFTDEGVIHDIKAKDRNWGECDEVGSYRQALSVIMQTSKKISDRTDTAVPSSFIVSPNVYKKLKLSHKKTVTNILSFGNTTKVAENIKEVAEINTFGHQLKMLVHDDMYDDMMIIIGRNRLFSPAYYLEDVGYLFVPDIDGQGEDLITTIDLLFMR